jgi:uncharacterized membrane protein
MRSAHAPTGLSGLDEAMPLTARRLYVKVYNIYMQSVRSTPSDEGEPQKLMGSGSAAITRPERSMTLTPLLEAPVAIQVHALAAMAALTLGLAQLALPKGTIGHRSMGWSWVLLMLIVALSSFLIHQIRLWGPWSPIHLLSILTLVTLPLAVEYARRGNVANHQWTMLSLFVGGLVVPGAFTFLPGRIMHAVAFGP